MLYIFIAILLLGSCPLQGMDSYLSQVIEPSQNKNQSYVPSLYSLAVTAVARSLVSPEHEVEQALTLAEAIDKGQWSHLKEQNDLLKVLSSDMLVDLVEATHGPAILRTLAHEETEGYKNLVHAMSLSSDGTKLAVSTATMVTIWDVTDLTDCKKIQELPVPVESAHRGGLQWTDDGNRLFLYKSGTIFCWNVSSWELMYSYHISDSWHDLVQLKGEAVFSPNGRYFLASHRAPLAPNSVLPAQARFLCNASSYLQGVLIDLDELAVFEKQRARGYVDEEVGIPHTIMSTHECCWREGSNYLGFSRLALAFSPNSRYAATSGADTTVRICDLEALPDTSFRVLEHDGIVCALAFSPDGNRLVTLSKEVEVDEERHKLFTTIHKLVLYLWNVSQGTHEVLESFCVDDYYRRYAEFEFPVNINFDGRFVVVQSVTNSDSDCQRLLYDTYRRRWVTLPDGEKLNRDFPDCCTIFSNDLRTLFIANGRTNNKVTAMSLLGAAHELSLREVVLLAHLNAGRLENGFCAEALKLRESLSSSLIKN